MTDDDRTVLLRPRRRTRWPVAAVLAAFAGLAGGGAWWALRPPSVAPLPAPASMAAFADETGIRADAPAALTVFRFSPNPAVVVLDFPALADQGRMLNRIAAWAEKKGVPHDRVLSDAELAAAIRASGTTPDTYYYGHDYRGADVRRFFELAARDGVALNADEQALQRLTGQLGGEPWGFGAVISLPRASEASGVDASMRRVILHHELSHGEYFTNAAYASWVGIVWRTVLTDGERARFRQYLANDGYDPALEDLMINEMQAYLMHTPDSRFFDEAELGIPLPRLAAIKAAFYAGMPSCWLRDETPPPSKPDPI